MDPVQSLQRIFGFDQFRPGQAEAVGAALADRDALVVMPTGSGKSLCYQLPALMRDDLTVVVSPLVSLMHDQARALEAVAPGKAGLINGLRGATANARTLSRAVDGELALLYVAPERFASARFVQRIRDARIGLFVVDEAHCVSQWGHDFRPDYYSLAQAAQALGARATVALTATATPSVAEDIVRRLELDDPLVVTTGFDRPNLTFEVRPCPDPAASRRSIAAALAEDDALPAIVYTGTREESEVIASVLEHRLASDVVTYHAGLERASRSRAQDRFMSGEADVIVATNAFGMGIDKAERTDRVPRLGPGLARGLLPGGRSRRARRRSWPLPVVRPASRPGPACLLHPAHARRGRHVSLGVRAAALGRTRWPLRRRAVGDRRRADRRGGDPGDHRPSRSGRTDLARALAA